MDNCERIKSMGINEQYGLITSSDSFHGEIDFEKFNKMNSAEMAETYLRKNCNCCENNHNRTCRGKLGFNECIEPVKNWLDTEEA